MNLQEKYDCGMISEEEWKKIVEFCEKKMIDSDTLYCYDITMIEKKTMWNTNAIWSTNDYEPSERDIFNTAVNVLRNYRLWIKDGRNVEQPYDDATVCEAIQYAIDYMQNADCEKVN